MANREPAENSTHLRLARVIRRASGVFVSRDIAEPLARVGPLRASFSC